MTPIEFEVSWSKVKVKVTFKLRGDIHISQTFLVTLISSQVLIQPDEGYILPKTGSLNNFVNRPGVLVCCSPYKPFSQKILYMYMYLVFP